MRKSVTLAQTIEFLNEIIALDRPAVAALIANRVPCNQALADHPTVQAVEQHGGFHVGMLGILNGLFGTVDGVNGQIGAGWDDGFLVGFKKVND